MIKEVPHDWLFPQVSAVVHHGGASTTAAVLRAGIPSVTVPFFADQPVWGEKLTRLGVSPANQNAKHDKHIKVCHQTQHALLKEELVDGGNNLQSKTIYSNCLAIRLNLFLITVLHVGEMDLENPQLLQDTTALSIEILLLCVDPMERLLYPYLLENQF